MYVNVTSDLQVFKIKKLRSFGKTGRRRFDSFKDLCENLNLPVLKGAYGQKIIKEEIQKYYNLEPSGKGHYYLSPKNNSKLKIKDKNILTFGEYNINIASRQWMKYLDMTDKYFKYYMLTTVTFTTMGNIINCFYHSGLFYDFLNDNNTDLIDCDNIEFLQLIQDFIFEPIRNIERMQRRKLKEENQLDYFNGYLLNDNEMTQLNNNDTVLIKAKNKALKDLILEYKLSPNITEFTVPFKLKRIYNTLVKSYFKSINKEEYNSNKEILKKVMLVDGLDYDLEELEKNKLSFNKERELLISFWYYFRERLYYLINKDIEEQVPNSLLIKYEKDLKKFINNYCVYCTITPIWDNKRKIYSLVQLKEIEQEENSMNKLRERYEQSGLKINENKDYKKWFIQRDLDVRYDEEYDRSFFDYYKLSNRIMKLIEKEESSKIKKENPVEK